MGEVCCAVHDGEQWVVERWGKRAFLWILRERARVPGDDPVAVVRNVALPRGSTLVIGLDRRSAVVRTLQQGRGESLLPGGVDVVLWERKAWAETGHVTEVIALPRREISALMDEARQRGLRLVVFPRWTLEGVSGPKPGDRVEWTDGSVARHRRGWGVWQDERRVGEGAWRGPELSLRAALRYARGRVPDGWSSGGQRGPSVPHGLLLLGVALVVWLAGRAHHLEQRASALERAEREHAKTLEPASVGSHVHWVLTQLSQSAPPVGATLDTLRLSQGELVLCGSWEDSTQVGLWAQRLGGQVHWLGGARFSMTVRRP